MPNRLLALLKTAPALLFITISILLDHSRMDGAYTDAIVDADSHSTNIL